jgi:hypothetical protein
MVGVTLTDAGRKVVRKIEQDRPGAKERREAERRKRKRRAERNAITKADREWVMAECKLLNAGRTAEAGELGAARHRAHENGMVVEQWEVIQEAAQKAPPAGQEGATARSQAVQ